ncbi:hypothetical protein Z046_00405 [Pseudomonas aeruginosa VRFPA09]|nr:hypothetical protein Z046_00405 [Pseudomonas aeruginosa VRFPA09]
MQRLRLATAVETAGLAAGLDRIVEFEHFAQALEQPRVFPAQDRHLRAQRRAQRLVVGLRARRRGIEGLAHRLELLQHLGGSEDLPGVLAEDLAEDLRASRFRTIVRCVR